MFSLFWEYIFPDKNLHRIYSWPSAKFQLSRSFAAFLSPPLQFQSSKRTVDFGLARGFSGIQEAKHRMGLAAAHFAGGPGRKRRSTGQS